MSLDSILERFVKAQERQADALEAIAKNLVTGEPAKPRGRPVGSGKKTEVIDGAPPVEATAEVVTQPAVQTNPAVADQKPASAMPVVQPPAASGPVGTVDLPSFQAAVGAACAKGHAAKVTAIFKKYGAEKASQVTEDKRALALAEVNALTAVAA